MRKVLFIVNHDLVIYNFRKELVIKLIELNYEVYICCPNGDKIDKLISYGAKHISADVDRHGKNIFLDLKLLLLYYKIIKKIKPDVVLTYTIKPNIYGGLVSRFTKTPYITTITGLGKSFQGGKLSKLFYITLYKISLKKSRRIYLQNSNNYSVFYQNKINSSNLKLIPGSGVNIDAFKYRKPTNNSIRNFVFSSRVMKDKGIIEFLKAAETIKKRYSNVEFHVCGFIDEDLDNLINEYVDKKIIIYHGFVSNMIEFMSKMDCLVHPSYHEGMANVILEAAAMGMFVIASNIPGCKEAIDDGKNGYLFEVKNVDMLIDKIEKYLDIPNDVIEKMSVYGRNKMEKEFDRSIIVRDYMYTIDNIIKEDK